MVRTNGTVNNEHDGGYGGFAHNVWLQDAQRLVRHACGGETSPVKVVERRSFFGPVGMQRVFERCVPSFRYVPKRVDDAVLLGAIAWQYRHPVQHVKGVSVRELIKGERLKKVSIATEHKRVAYHWWTLARDGNVLQLCTLGTAADIDLDLLARVSHVVQTTNDAQQLRQMLVGNRHIQHNVAYGEMRPAWHYKLVDECVQRVVLSVDDTFCRHGALSFTI